MGNLKEEIKTEFKLFNPYFSSILCHLTKEAVFLKVSNICNSFLYSTSKTEAMKQQIRIHLHSNDTLM